MNESAPLIVILRLCAATVPWYPKDAADSLGLSESDLIAFVEQLRQGGLIVRTDPVPGHGRGYVLTPAGTHALKDPGDLEWLSRGEVPPAKTPTDDGQTSTAVMERERAVRMSLLAPFTARVVRGLILANFAVFLWGLYLAQQRGIAAGDFLNPRNGLQLQDIAHETGAVKVTDVRPPGWGLLRLLTCCFVHFGLVHLGANMLSLYFIGPLLERMWGHLRFLVLYIIAGFGGSCVAMVYKPTIQGQAVTLAGASGAIWGIMASMAVWVILNRRYMPRRLLSSWGLNIIIVFAINIAITQSIPGISAEAHYGGGIVGAGCAVLLHLTRFGPVALRGLAGAVVATLPVLGLWAVTHPDRFNPAGQPGRMNEEQIELKEVWAVDRDEKEAQDKLMGSPADLLLLQEPAARDEGNRNNALEKYKEARERLQPAVDRLQSLGKLEDSKAEEIRTVRLELLEARLKLWTLEERCLKDGKKWPDSDKENSEQIERVKELEERWKKLRPLH